MATKIRMTRAGAKKRPFYRIVVADSRAPRDGKFIEKLGTFNPLLAKDSAERVVLNTERVAFWLGQGAQPSDRVAGLLIAANLYKRTAHKQRVLDARIAKAKAEKAAKAKAEAEQKAKEEAELKAKEAAEAAEKKAKEKAEAEAAKQAAAEAAAASEAPQA